MTGGREESSGRQGCIMPTRDQFKQLMATSHSGPIIMMNMLRYKPEGGRESYARYESGIKGVFDRIGGRVLNRGEFMQAVIGHEAWDDIFFVEYPSIAAFIEMQRDPEYQAAVPHRTAALLDSRLFMLKPAAAEG